jgi:hypothetical protein
VLIVKVEKAKPPSVAGSDVADANSISGVTISISIMMPPTFDVLHLLPKLHVARSGLADNMAQCHLRSGSFG